LDQKADWFPVEFDWILGATGFLNLNSASEVRNVYGANMSFKKEAFLTGNLFLTYLGANGGGGGLGNQKFACEETEFSIRTSEETRGRLIFNPDVRVKHKVYRYRITPVFIVKRAYSEGYTKAMLNRRFRKNGKHVLLIETGLLKRILTQLFPGIFRTFFRNPLNAYRKLCVSTIALISVAIGYFTYLTRNL
jgi:hypothetical protein